MQLTNSQLVQVKKILDEALWDGEVSHPDRYPDDGYNACNYMNKQRFSMKKIAEFVKDVDTVDVYEHANNQVEYVPEAVAVLIADGLATDRVRPFLYKKTRKPGHGWYLPESWVFSLRNPVM